MGLSRIHPISIDGDPLDGIVGISTNDGVVITRPLQDGLADPTFAAIASISPAAEFQSRAIATALGITGFASVIGDVVFYDALIGDDGAKASGSSHVKYDLSSAITVPRTLQASHGQDAIITLASMGFGSSMPLVKTTSSALSSYSPGGDELYSIGPVEIDGTGITSVQSIAVNFGFQLVPDMADDDIFPRDIKVLSRMASIDVTVSDPAEVDNVLSSDLPLCMSSGAVVYFKKRSCAGAWVGDSTEEHVKITCAKGIVTPVRVSGSPRIAAFRIEPFKDSSNEQMVVNPASAIT